MSGMYGTCEAPDRSELIGFDAGEFLDTLATHYQNFPFSTFAAAEWGTTRENLRMSSEFQNCMVNGTILI